VYDLEAICKQHKLKIEDHCWPVLLSSKPGVQALALCPDHARHGGIKSAFHKCPPHFDRIAASKKPYYAQPATPAQIRDAGWHQDKRFKT
jgi:hypothetical protein